MTAEQYGFVDESPAEQYNTLGGGSLLLEPELADTISYGIVFTPGGSSFTAALDYYKTEVDDLIGSYRADDVLNACLATGDPAMCDLVHRDRYGSLWIVEGEAYTEVINQNIGKAISEGVDVNLNWVLPAGNSFFTLNLIGTYLLSNTTDNGFYNYDCVGYYGDVCNNFGGWAYGLTPDWRHLSRVSWETGSIVLSLGWRYINGMAVEARSPDAGLSDPDSLEAWKAVGSYEIPATNYFDLAFNWKLVDGLQFTIGCNNVLDEEPPYGAGISNYDYGPGFWGAYDVYGRYLFSSIQFEF
jgi:outer membrane receptor protein involved in Fe transport